MARVRHVPKAGVRNLEQLLGAVVGRSGESHADAGVSNVGRRAKTIRPIGLRWSVFRNNAGVLLV